MEYQADFDMWLRTDDHRVVGQEDARLLEMINEKGSISEAAISIGRSYRYAWAAIKEMEAALGVKLVSSKRGGRSRGSTSLTNDGKKVLDEYMNQRTRFTEQLEHLYRNPTLTADGIVVMDGNMLLVRRGKEPGKGKMALPGGFVEYGETTQECIRREVIEETGLVTEVLDLIGIYSDPDRDPRGHLISVVYLLHVIGGSLHSGDDAQEANFYKIDELPDLAFDHRSMVEDYLVRRRTPVAPPRPKKEQR